MRVAGWRGKGDLPLKSAHFVSFELGLWGVNGAGMGGFWGAIMVDLAGWREGSGERSLGVHKVIMNGGSCQCQWDVVRIKALGIF